MSYILFILSLLFLIIAAHFIVIFSKQLSLSLGLPKLFIGLTLLAFGTGTPELAVGISAAIHDYPTVVLGSVLGSNIVNIFLVLGVCALIRPLKIQPKLLRFDLPFLFFATLFLFLFVLFKHAVTTAGAVVLILIGVSYLVFLAFRDQKAYHHGKKGTFKSLIGLIVSLSVLILSAKGFLSSVVDLARQFHISEFFISLTLVALGTSLPELITSLAAHLKKEDDLIVGNIVGSNLFNLCAVLGISVLFLPQSLEIASAIIEFDLPILLLATVALFPLFMTGSVLSRTEGGLLITFYISYLWGVSYGQHLTFSEILKVVIIPFAGFLIASFFLRRILFVKK